MFRCNIPVNTTSSRNDDKEQLLYDLSELRNSSQWKDMSILRTLADAALELEGDGSAAAACFAFSTVGTKVFCAVILSTGLLQVSGSNNNGSLTYMNPDERCPEGQHQTFHSCQQVSKNARCWVVGQNLIQQFIRLNDVKVWGIADGSLQLTLYMSLDRGHKMFAIRPIAIRPCMDSQSSRY